MTRFRFRFRFRPARLLLAASVALGGAASSAALAAPASAAPLHGIQISKVGDGDPVGELATARAMGAQVVRAEIRWNTLEPDAAGTQDPVILAQADALMAAAREQHIKVLLTVVGSPCWASTAPARGDCTTAEQRRQAVAYPPAQPSAFADVAAFLAKRYATALAAFEVWNEPDHANEDYFAGPAKAQRYAALLKAAYPAIKQAAPGVPVLGGAIVGANGVFLKALYRAGIKGHYDGLSVHYYDLVLASLRSIRQVQRANGDSKPLWLSEFGWTSCRPARTQDGHACVTPAVQAADLVDVYRALARTSYVKAAVVYTVQDTPQYDFGVVDEQGRRKPAFAALRGAWARPGALRPVVLRLAGASGHVVASGSAPAGDALELDVFQGAQLRYKAVFRLDRDGRYRLRLPSLARRGMTVRVTQYWSGRTAQRRIG